MISVLIVNYYHKKYLHDCISSVVRFFGDYPFEIIIINNSPEEDIEEIKKLSDKITVVPNDNKGYPASNNKAAFLAKGGYLLFLNPDTVIMDGDLKGLTEEIKKPGTGIAGLGLINDDESFQVSFGRKVSILNEWKNKRMEIISRHKDKRKLAEWKNKYSATAEVDWVSGASLFISRELFEELNGFDESYFLYYEDCDLCNRALNRGYKIIYYPYFKIKHFKGENIKENFLRESYLYAKQSQLNYYSKHRNIFERYLLKLYFIFKYSLKYLFSGNKIYRQIIKSAVNVY